MITIANCSSCYFYDLFHTRGVGGLTAKLLHIVLPLASQVFEKWRKWLFVFVVQTTVDGINYSCGEELNNNNDKHICNFSSSSYQGGVRSQTEDAGSPSCSCRSSGDWLKERLETTTFGSVFVLTISSYLSFYILWRINKLLNLVLNVTKRTIDKCSKPLYCREAWRHSD